MAFLGATASSAMAQPSSYVQTVEGDGPVAYYQLGDQAGSTQAADSAGTNPMTAYNGVTFGTAGPPGVGTTAVSLNGSNQYLAEKTPVLSQTSNWTIEGWFDPGSSSQAAIMAYDGNDPAGFGFGQFSAQQYGSAGSCLAGIFGYVSWLLPANQQCFTPGTWYYIVLERDASGNASFYVNGQLESVGSWSSGNHTPNTPQGGTEVGGQFDASNNPWRYFQGSIAQVAFYNYALSGSQVLAHYDATLAPPTAPQNTTVPTISGTPQDGQVLSAGKGSWAGSTPLSYAYQWESCDSSGSNCQNISGATSNTYTAGPSDIGETLEVDVTASNSAGSASATSAPTAAVAAAPPSNTVAPTIAGSAQPGQQLTANPGTWSGTTPLAYTYQWQSCDKNGQNCQDISGAAQSTYTVGSGDIGNTIMVVVTASNSAGSATANSTQTPVVGSPTNTSEPSISGTAQDGQTLTAGNGQWSEGQSLSYAYQWRSCDDGGAHCSSIAGATTATYQLGPGDVGGTVDVVVTASNTAGSTNATSAPSGVVAVAPAPTITDVTHSNLPSGSVSSGTDSVTARATSSGPGVQQFEITDQQGTTIANYTASCAGTNSNPCPSSSTQTLTVNYANLPLGQDTLYLTAVDAAGAASTAASWSVTISAPTSCTDSWTGSAGDGLWQTAGNWSEGTVPGDHDYACTPAGATIQVSAGNNAVGRVDAQGTIHISNGTLSIADSTAPSSLQGLSLTGQNATLSGAGEVDVSGSFDWSGGTMSGSGSTVVGSSVLGTIDPPNNSVPNHVILDGRTLTNNGTLTFSSGVLVGGDGASVVNAGTFNANSEVGDQNYGGTYGLAYNTGLLGGARPTFTNSSTGTLEKTAGTGTTNIGFDTTNNGRVVLQSGNLNFSGGDAPGATGTWDASASGTSVTLSYGGFTFAPTAVLIGRVVISGAAVTAPSAAWPQAAIELKSGSLTFTDSSTATTVGSLNLDGGTLAGDGEIDIPQSLDWSGGTMSGSGSTVIDHGAIASIDPQSNAVPNHVILDGRTLTNNGTTTLSSGVIQAGDGAQIQNYGTFNANSQDRDQNSCCDTGLAYDLVGGVQPRFINDGTLDKSSGSGTTDIAFAVDNEGHVEANSGTIALTGGGIGSQSGPTLDDPLLCGWAPNPQAGSWTSDETANISFAGGCWMLGPSTTITGEISVDGATVEADAIAGPQADISDNTGTLAFVNPNAAAVLQSLYVSGTLTGIGDVDVCGNLTWQSGTLNGTGATFICPGATGQIDPPSSDVTLNLDARSLINEGTLTWSSGNVQFSYGATLWNKGTLVANSETQPMTTADGSGIVYNDNGGSITKNQTAPDGSHITPINVFLLNQGTPVTASVGQIKFGGANEDSLNDDPNDDTDPYPTGSQPAAGTCTNGTADHYIATSLIWQLGQSDVLVAGHAGVVCGPGGDASGNATLTSSDGIGTSQQGQTAQTLKTGACANGPECVITLGALVPYAATGYPDGSPDFGYDIQADFDYESGTTGPPNPIDVPMLWHVPTVPAISGNMSAASYETLLTQAGLRANVETLPADEAAWGLPAGDVQSTDPKPGTPELPGTKIDVYVNPNPMPDPTKTGEADDPSCDLSNPDYVVQADQTPSGFTQVTDPGLVSSPTFDTSMGPTVLNYGYADASVTESGTDFGGWGYWHILAGHGWSSADDAATRLALEDPTPEPGLNPDAVNAWVFYGPKYSGTGSSVTCRRVVVVDFGTASGDPGPKGVITSYGANVTSLPAGYQ